MCLLCCPFVSVVAICVTRNWLRRFLMQYFGLCCRLVWVPQTANITACQTLHPQPGTLTQPYLASCFSTPLHPPNRLYSPGIPHNHTVVNQARKLSRQRFWTLCSVPANSSCPVSPENSFLAFMTQLKHFFLPVSLQTAPECLIHPVPNVQSYYTTPLTSVSVKCSIGKKLFCTVYMFFMIWHDAIIENIGSLWRKTSQTIVTESGGQLVSELACMLVHSRTLRWNGGVCHVPETGLSNITNNLIFFCILKHQLYYYSLCTTQPPIWIIE